MDLSLDKGTDYYEEDRTEFLDWVGGEYRRVLDVGCGSGSNAAWYRARGARHIVGVEVHTPSAQRAALAMDEVHNLTIETALPRLTGPFDLIVCADVLEHLVDPWTVVRQLSGLASPESILAISVPNIRFLPAVVRIAVGRGFAYEERGIFDSTHLRFFTPDDVTRLAQSGGWEPRRRGGPRPVRGKAVRSAMRTIFGGRADQWLASQVYLVAVRT